MVISDVHHYINTLTKAFHNSYIDLNYDDRNVLSKCIKEYVFSCLYNQIIFAHNAIYSNKIKTFTKKCEYIRKNIKLLKFHNYKEKYDMNIIVNCLNGFEKLYTPYQKLDCIINMFTIISKKYKTDLNSDDILSLLILGLIMQNSNTIISSLAFINEFEILEIGSKYEYIYITLLSSIVYVIDFPKK